MEILRIENLSFRYAGAKKVALDNISFSINSGDFVVICGESGCGKTTLLKLLKRELAPYGEKKGKIIYRGINQSELDERTSTCDIGYVLQNPENQVVTDKVWHELAFGLENLGYPTEIIRRRVSEMASYFGIQTWFRKNTSELSGGQKQMLNLASIMVMQPKILILDEPTSQLDPIAAADFIGTLQKLNKELGLTIILVEHRLEDVFPIADKVMLLEEGNILLFDFPDQVSSKLRKINGEHKMLTGLPSAVRIFHGLDVEGACPLTVKDGRNFLEENYDAKINTLDIIPYCHSERIVLEMKNIWFRYERDLPDVLRGVTFSVYEGETFCILGGNGTGKTTTLNVLAGINKAYRGKTLVQGKKISEFKGNSLYRHNIALLPQNPQMVFLKKTVLDDFQEICKIMEYENSEKEALIQDVSNKLGILHLLDCHPYDLSGGEQQKAALAKMLLLKPKILLLDEPTKGIDTYSKQSLSLILKDLKKEGITIVIVTHDIEFAAINADRCALFFDGEITSIDTPTAFFADNNFYTTAANRIARNLYKNAITCDDVVKLCKMNQLKVK
ncbi:MULTISPECIES: ABC transporter ATP-binding protein [Clostridium]|uniref:Cobalt ABC transporter ATP-binding protein n=1 Tax=Clostridium cadaveris TaxID=1529 RepID=A0A1I2L6H8_9CLOT|nr:ABC transporter ATP-binding protein [Clostridium cadaveris]MDU4951729.1 energy-coupling factor transporter ATPase [Clostridium sp.]MDM8312712.1 energy-coupling factor transporter ATPase [Clostridium cadaveris]NME64741.1 ATP-binding cassette domain-containing protein [Clostridium cadaveris]PWL52395.1 MAG: cobalt ABC transporter ATP-binding protein [Clostridium cadaveris]SFF74835.1 energy-coupling factor transport system ATP-binding protein [Clostridium cadaveris]